ncbi:MAG: hypothetical protein WEE50_08985 [Chloroflexota bacterium]
MTDSNVVGTFLPSRNGFHFANRFPSGPTVRFGPIDPRRIGVGDAAAGLCGGMAWFVRERFEADQPIPPDTQPPANGSPLFQVLVRRQVKSLEWLRTPLGFWWMGAFGADRIARRTRETHWPRIRATIDAGRLAMVGLVRNKGVNPFNLTKNHQVLCYGYDATEGTIRLRLYDPNWPDRDDVTVAIEPDRASQSTGETLFGVLSLD